MKICAISDLHGYLPEDIQKCDLLLIAGDIMPLNIQGKMPQSLDWIAHVFKPWAENLPCEKVLFIAGNHDIWLERNHKVASDLFPSFGKVTYLLNESFVYMDNEGKQISIFGSPYCHIFGNWAFMVSDDAISKKLDELPENTHILLTHDAPYGTNDICLESVYWNHGDHIGNKPLRDAIIAKKPVYNIHGHLHSTGHTWEQLASTKVICVSLKDEKYQVNYEPLYFDI